MASILSTAIFEVCLPQRSLALPGALTVGNLTGGISSYQAQDLSGAVVLGGRSSGTFQLPARTNLDITSAIAIGNAATVATGSRSVSIGMGAGATGANSISVGQAATAATNATAVGSGAVASGASALAAGVGATASTTNATALGHGSLAQGSSATAVGSGASASGANGFAGGSNAQASGTAATAVGSGAVASGASALAAGVGATATSTNAIALGRATLAQGNNATAVGSGATAAFANSTAIGTGAVTTRADQVAIGTANQAYQLPGLASNGNFVGRANQSGSTQVMTVDGQGNLGTSSLDLDQGFTGLGSGINAMGAMTAAMSALPTSVSSEDEWGRCGLGGGATGGISAAALGCAMRVGERLHLNGAIAFGPSYDYQFGSTASLSGRVGLSFPLGVIHRAKPMAAAVLPNGQAVAEAIGDRDLQIARLTRQIGDLQSRLQIQASAGDTPAVSTAAAQIRELQTQVRTLRAKLAATTSLTAANLQLLNRIRQLETQMIQIQAMAAKSGQPGESSSTIVTLERRINEQDTLIRSLIERLNVVQAASGSKTVAPSDRLPASLALIPIKPVETLIQHPHR